MPTLHAIANVLLLLACAAVGVFFCRTRRGAISLIISGCTIAVLGLVLRWRPDLLVAALPWRDVIFYSNFVLPATLLMTAGAIGLGKTRAQKWRLLGLGVALVTVGSLETFRLFAAPAEPGSPYFDDGALCRQTSPDTCSAAAAVTLLQRYGVTTTEAEVAALALSKRDRGTHPLGLYRAIKSLAPRNSRVRLGRSSIANLVATKNPAIVAVGLPPASRDPIHAELAQKYDWTPGVVHDVVLLGTVSGNPSKVAIAEPDFGYEEWPREHLEALYRGLAFTIVQ